MFYILFFICLMILTRLMSNIEKNYIFKTIIIGGLISSLIALRSYEIGNDTMTYVELFTSLNDYDSFFKNESRYEIGFVLLVRILGLCTENPRILLVFSAIVTVIPIVYLIFRESERPELSIFLLFALGFFGFFLSAMRQSLALSFIFMAYYFLCNKRKILYLVFTILGILFHKTAIFSLAILPLLLIKFNLKNSLSLIIASGIFTFLLPIILRIIVAIFPEYSAYINGSYFNGDGFAATLFNSMILVITLLLIKISIGNLKMDFDSINNNLKYKLFYISFIILAALQIIAFSANIMDRIMYYFSIVLVLSIPYLTNYMLNNNTTYFIISMVIIYSLKFLIIMAIRPEWNRIYPYKFFWQ